MPEPFSAAKPYRVQFQLAKPPAEVELQIQYGSQDRFIHARCRPEPRNGGTLQIVFDGTAGMPLGGISLQHRFYQYAPKAACT